MADAIMVEKQAQITSAATKLRRMLNNSKSLILCPGVYDGFSARIALDVGFDAYTWYCRSFTQIHTIANASDHHSPEQEQRLLA